MDKENFSNLYLNANTIIYVSMQETLAALAADVDPMPAKEEQNDQSAAESESRTGLESLDLAALAKVWDSVPSASPEPDNFGGDEADITEGPEENYHAGWLELDARGGIDYADYMKKVYAETSLQQPVDSIYENADLQRVDVLLAELPQGVTPLNERLSGDDLQQWVNINKQGNAALRDLALYIRKITIDTGIPA